MQIACCNELVQELSAVHAAWFPQRPKMPWDSYRVCSTILNGCCHVWELKRAFFNLLGGNKRRLEPASWEQELVITESFWWEREAGSLVGARTLHQSPWWEQGVVVGSLVGTRNFKRSLVGARKFLGGDTSLCTYGQLRHTQGRAHTLFFFYSCKAWTAPLYGHEGPSLEVRTIQ